MEHRNETHAQGRIGDDAPMAGRSDIRLPPRSLREALRDAGIRPGYTRVDSETPSEEDYDKNIRPSLTSSGIRQRVQRSATEEQSPILARSSSGVHTIHEGENRSHQISETSTGQENGPQSMSSKKAGKVRDFVFTRQFSAFDRNNTTATSSPFHGFYTLFWMGVAIFVLKISAENWRTYGDPFGTKDIMRTMFSRDVVVLLVSDGVMCALTGMTWLTQRIVARGFISWNHFGWILQHIWQTTFIACVVGWTMVRDWPWTHTVYFVLHGIIMLMKQHSYAFYNGHLSEISERRRFLLSKLGELESLASKAGPATAGTPTPQTQSTGAADQALPPAGAGGRLKRDEIDRISHIISSRDHISIEQSRAFERTLTREVEILTDELKGTASDPSKAYPANLGFVDHYKWIPLPTVVYEIEYPRSSSISWSYVAEKVVAMIGVLFVMVQISQYSMYPVVMETIKMKEQNPTLQSRLKEFPWIISNLIFPFMMEYLLVWYLIWEIILNILAEVTYFADRRFYDAWWNSVSWDQFARGWNRPVHVFLLRHVYHSSISSLKVNKHTATLITFFLSACIHELVMWCLFKKLRGYLLAMQMFQLPMVKLSRTRWLKGRETLGNMIFWLGIFTGPSLLCSLYLII